MTQRHHAQDITGACAWEHCVPKMAAADPRMSLTFRHIEDNGDDILGRRTFSVPTAN